MNLQTLQAKQDKLLLDAKALYTKAEKEGAFNDEDAKAYDAKMKEAESIDGAIVKLKSDQGLLDGLNAATEGAIERHVDRRLTVKSLGQQFIESEAGKYLAETKAGRARGWQSPVVELKATLTSDPASGGALVTPDYRPGVVPTPQRPIVMAELFANGPTSSNAIVFMEEASFVNAAAPVLEAGVKPESTLTFRQKTNKVEKIAHWLPVTDELLEDEPAMQAYIDARLRLGVLLALDNQLLNGTGVSPELLGLLVRTDLTPPLPVGTEKSADAIAMQIAAVEQASGLAVDGIVLNPTDYLKMALTKTTDGTYVGRNPFEAPIQPVLWGRTIALTSAMPLGTGLVGSFRSGGGQLFQRGGLRVDASNSHADFFVKNLTAVRSEIRVALVLYRPTAFGKVTGLNTVTP